MDATDTTRTTPDYLNTQETISFRLGAAIRDQAIPAFISACGRQELTALASVAPSNRPMVSEATAITIIRELSNRVDSLDAAGERMDAKGRKDLGERYRQVADLAQAAQVAWVKAGSRGA